MKTLLISSIALLLLIAGVALTQNSRNPHGQIKWDCQDCHTTASWTDLREEMVFSHEETGFRLDGAHRQAVCAECHRDPVFSHVGTACADCHSDHHQGQLGLACAECHTPRDWQPRRDILLQHAEQGFPLTGVHAVADCEACHNNRDRQEYVGTPTQCEACHAADAAGIVDPDHQQLAFQADCERCHHAAFGTWSRTTYEHPASFPLTGAHLALNCSACHEGGFAGTPGECYDCHAPDFAATTDPNHEQGGFAPTCTDCHSTSAWVPATFDHAATGFALIGQHVNATCISCHEGGYTQTPSTCYACHQADYDGSANPNHASAGMPTECEVCHTPNGWQPASYDHDLTGFPLTGQHVGLACASCHEGSYTGTSPDCASCHQTDYDATTDPGHLAAGFSTACQTCHTSSGWTPATWDHDAQYFPIYSGTHRNRWSTCSECHTVPTDFGTFECITCHEHNKTDTDADHAEENVPNYRYVSTACYECHPRGTH